jgi:site-specific recombinase XerD
VIDEVEPARDLASLAVPLVGRLEPTGDRWLPFRLVDSAGEPVEAVSAYFRDLQAAGRAESTLRSYGMDLLRWFRFLWAIDARWERATRVEARDFCRWMLLVGKPDRPHWRRPGQAPGRRPAGREYAPSVRAHSETVLRGFYGFHLDAGTGPLLNPFPLDRSRQAGRMHAHHNPMQPFRNERVGLYRPRVPKRVPRSIPDELFNEIFARLPSHRDRALVAFYVSTGARAAELLSATRDGVDPGRQLITVIRKGTREAQELPASTDAFVWLRLYQVQMEELIPKGRHQPLWWTLRRPFRPLTYHAAHRMFERVNAQTGSSATLHALRHTAAYRMAEDPSLPLTDVQFVLGHAQLTTTQLYTNAPQGGRDPQSARSPRRADSPDDTTIGSGSSARVSGRVAGRAVRTGSPVTAVATAVPVAESAPKQRPATRFPPRPVKESWPATLRSRPQVMRRVASLLSRLPTSRAEYDRRRGLALLLDWLEEQPGQTWQERWLNSGADTAGERWAQGPAQWLRCSGKYSANRLELMTSSLLLLVGSDVVRPSLGWLLTGGKKRKLARNMIRARDPEGFEKLLRCCEQNQAITIDAQKRVLFRTAVIIAAKGGVIADITVGDLLEMLDAESGVRSRADSGSTTFWVLREMGIFGAGVPALREIRDGGQRSVEELVDRHRIACRPIRDLLVDYLKERQLSIDYTTLFGNSYQLVKCFWLDLEQHHPGIGSLRLPPQVAAAWKQRLRTRNKAAIGLDGERIEIEVERLGYLDILAGVRAFYLDLAQWALEDPARWGPWVAPCPISQRELSRRKADRRRKARMDARTRERLPVLPVLVRAADQWRKDTQALLAAARDTPHGQPFTAAGQTLVRYHRPHANPNNVWATEPDTGQRRLLNREEEHAFWAWAIIEVLRLTGIRVEELTELSHHSLVQYRLPTSGELVPLLQIAPSKTDMERLLVVSPELADTLSTVIRRVRSSDRTVPLVRARDPKELVWLPPAPLLFQRRLGTENRAFTHGVVSALLDEALAHTGLADPATGQPLRYRAHDFRRIFITDAVLNGLPPHIAQVIAGHQDISVTMGYKAVYPEEAIKSHLAFLARRRALRPTEEYRVPTDKEWQDFLGHFERRKVSTGTCGRAFGTPCIHEHACIRCSMLWPDPAQRERLAEIRDNLIARIIEAKREGWLGEVEGLQISLTGAEDKLAQIDNRPHSRGSVDLGIPNIAQADN